MNQKRSRKMSVELSPVQMIWLHSQHLFQKIEQNTMQTNNEIKFYKNNNGVQIRFQRSTQQPNIEVMLNAKKQLQKMIQDNEIRLMNTSLHKEIYVRISKQARRQFPKTYIIFLHYETFENCCRKLKQKFSITSIIPQFERFQKQNPFFCFLIAEKAKIDQVQRYTNRILNSEVSCASTTFSSGQRPNQTPNIYKRTMSVSSLKGSFTSYDQHNQIEHCRLSINNSDAQQQMFQVSEISLANLSQNQLDGISKKNMYFGSRVHIQRYQGRYLNMKKKLYYANRLQLCANTFIQPIYAYSMHQKNGAQWQLSIITDKIYTRLSQLVGTLFLHSPKKKIEILLRVGRALHNLHLNRQSYGDLNQQNILLDSQKNLYLSSIIDKNIPPHTNPFKNDIRQYLLLMFRLLTQTQITPFCLEQKFQKNRYFCTISHKCKNELLREFLIQADRLFIEEITFEHYLAVVQSLIHQY